MNLKLYACLAVGALVVATQAVATPMHPGTVFLAVDVNGANTAGGQTPGPTQAGFQGWDVLAITDVFDANYGTANNWTALAPTGMGKSFATTQGNISATLSGNGTSYSARNRGANAGGMSDLYRDFVFSQRDIATGYGRFYDKVTLSGLTPNQSYEFTGFAREPSNTSITDPNDPQMSYQAWTDRAALGGLDGPLAWMDANVSVGADYQPSVGGGTNPIPHYARSQTTGPDSLSLANPFFHSASFITKADGSGVVTVYTWADPNGNGGSVQGASLLNGFQLANIPEPASLVLFAIGLVCLIGLRRRMR